MDSDQGKLFIGGISWETTEDRLKEYFNSYGEVLQAVIMKDKITGRPRGFGFIVFADPDVLDRVLQDKHSIDGRTVEAKRALSREEQHTSSRSGNFAGGRSMGGGGGGSGGNLRTKKIFVGGLPASLTEDGFRQYFETYGAVTDVVIMYDQSTQRPRGFGFISFDTEDAVDRVLHKTFHDLNGKLVEVKRALPKDANPSSTGGGRSSGGGSYQSYGNSNTSSGSYDGRMDTNRYMQPQPVGGGYPGYGTPNFGATGYGYGGAGNGVGYGGYGLGGYGGPAAGYGGPTGAYGNPNAAGGGYGTGPPGAPRSPWNNQAPSGYGSAGYGSGPGYGTAAAWNAPAGGGGGNTATPAQTAGAAGYGNQGYGYGGGYGGGDGSYGNQQGGYASGGVRGGISGTAGNASGGGSDQGSGSVYMGSGYNDGYGGSGYSSSWRSDPSSGTVQTNGPGGPANYGGYGGAQSRQSQQ